MLWCSGPRFPRGCHACVSLHFFHGRTTMLFNPMVLKTVPSMFGPIQSVRSLFGFRFVSSNVLFTPGCFGNLFVFGPVHVQHGIDKFVVIDASTVFGVVDIYYSSGSSTGKSTVKICHCMTKRRVTDGTFFVLMLRSVLAKHIQHVLASRFRVVGCNC